LISQFQIAKDKGSSVQKIRKIGTHVDLGQFQLPSLPRSCSCENSPQIWTPDCSLDGLVNPPFTPPALTARQSCPTDVSSWPSVMREPSGGGDLEGRKRHGGRDCDYAFREQMEEGPKFARWRVTILARSESRLSPEISGFWSANLCGLRGKIWLGT
jgi:hypothetical protein